MQDVWIFLCFIQKNGLHAFILPVLSARLTRIVSQNFQDSLSDSDMVKVVFCNICKLYKLEKQPLEGQPDHS